MLLLDNVFGKIMRVFVIPAVAELFHERSGSVPEMERDWQRTVLLDVGRGSQHRRVGGVRFWRAGQIRNRLGEGNASFGQSHEVNRVFGGDSNLERPRIGITD